MSWTEPPWSGWIATTGDALIMLEAARRGVIPRVTRRLVDAERKMICSGSVFVFDEDESGIKRWTDGLFWSPSRILGNFLLYRETDKRGAGHRRAGDAKKSKDGIQPDGAQPGPAGADSPAVEPKVEESATQEEDPLDTTLSRPRNDASRSSTDRVRERTLVGSLTNSYKFKADGLMKKTFSLTIQGVSQHLISYYKPEDVESGRLRSPSSIPELAALEISPEYLEKTHFRIPPRIEVGRDGRPRYAGEADDDAPPSPRTALLPDVDAGMPMSAGFAPQPRRKTRVEPYPVGAGVGATKRRRKTDPGAPPPLDMYPTRSPPSAQSPTLGSSPEDSQYYGEPPVPNTVPYYPPTYGYGYPPAPGGAYETPSGMTAYVPPPPPAPFDGGASGTYAYGAGLASAPGTSSYPNPYSWGASGAGTYSLYGPSTSAAAGAPATPRTHQGALPAATTSPTTATTAHGALSHYGGLPSASSTHGEVRRR